MVAIPLAMKELTNLEVLKIASNQINSKSHLQSICSLISLKHLDASHNGITSDRLPYSISQLTNLTFLNLSRNDLTYLPASIMQFVLLKKLDISENVRLCTVPYTISNLSVFFFLLFSYLCRALNPYECTRIE